MLPVSWALRALSVRAVGPSIGTRAGLCSLHAPPLRLHRFERRLMHRFAAGLERLLEALEAGAELLVRLAQRRLGFDAQLAREVGDREEQVAHFLGDALGRLEI